MGKEGNHSSSTFFICVYLSSSAVENSQTDGIGRPTREIHESLNSSQYQVRQHRLPDRREMGITRQKWKFLR